MPSVDEDIAVPNGANGKLEYHNDSNEPSRPETPTGSMSLTEYSANPRTPSEEKRALLREQVPADLLLPNGFPDVSRPSVGSIGFRSRVMMLRDRTPSASISA